MWWRKVGWGARGKNRASDENARNKKENAKAALEKSKNPKKRDARKREKSWSKALEHWFLVLFDFAPSVGRFLRATEN